MLGLLAHNAEAAASKHPSSPSCAPKLLEVFKCAPMSQQKEGPGVHCGTVMLAGEEARIKNCDVTETENYNVS